MHDPANAPKLGQLLTGEPQRDAIHIAIMPVVAGETLNPGDHVDVRDGKAYRSEPYVGIVDPFLPGAITPGARFWLLLTPYTITSLRHEWTHPAFPSETITEKQASEAWLRGVCSKYHISYDELLAAGEDEGGEDYISLGDDERAASELNGDREEIRKHLSVVLGRELKRGPWFSCAC